MKSQRQGRGRGSPLPQGLDLSRGGLGEGGGALQDTDPNLFPGIPGPRLGELEGPGEKARISLTSLSAWQPPLL